LSHSSSNVEPTAAVPVVPAGRMPYCHVAASVVAAALLSVASPALAGRALRSHVPVTPSADDLMPELFGLTTSPPLPTRQWVPASESKAWPVQQRDWRRRILKRSADFKGELKGAVDSVPDDFLWRNFSSWEPRDIPNEFWESLCNSSHSTNHSLEAWQDVNSSFRSLDGWAVRNGTACREEDQLGEETFTDETKAAEACGGICGSLHDVGCRRKKFRLCKLGAGGIPSSAGSCLRLRVPGVAPVGGSPSGPQEAEFWKELCSQPAVRFRLLFPRRLCTSAKLLPLSHSEGACAERAAADPGCAELFDYEVKAGSPPICRCVPLGTECAAPLPTAAPGSERNVFLRG